MTFGDFEWDADKAAANLAKHGITFEEAATIFLDLDYLLLPDAAEPERFMAIGCERGEKIRIISARRATRRERETYERRQKSD